MRANRNRQQCQELFRESPNFTALNETAAVQVQKSSSHAVKLFVECAAIVNNFNSLQHYYMIKLSIAAVSSNSVHRIIENLLE